MREKDIQKYLWDKRKNFEDLIEKIDIPEKIKHEKPWEYTPSEIIYNILIEKYREMYEGIFNLSIFAYEVPLNKESDAAIRADFLGVLNGRNGLAVVELKKSKQTERQAFTELLAYGSHVRGVFAPMSKMDIAYILIAPMQERIVREATIQNFIYDRNEIFALIPIWQNDDLATLKLKPWIPSFEEVNALTVDCFSESNFDIFKVTWDALPGEWGNGQVFLDRKFKTIGVIC